MALLRLTYSGNVYDAAPAGTVDFPLVTKGGKNIPYLQRSHIHVYRSADQGATWAELARPAQWDFDSTGTIARLKSAITGEWILVRRITPYQDLYTQFQDSSLLTADQLNEAEKFGLYVNQEQFDGGDQGFWSDPRQVVTKPMQRAGAWPADGKDEYIATTDAIAARHDNYLQPGLPTPVVTPEKEQPGKLWLDNDEILQRFWDPTANAWVTLANTGPQGEKGPKGDRGEPGGVAFKGDLDVTVAPPAGVQAGWQYVSLTTGAPHVGFNGLSGTINKGNVLLYSGAYWILQQDALPGITDATESVRGVVELASPGETEAGTDATRAVHPAGLKVALDKKLDVSTAASTYQDKAGMSAYAPRNSPTFTGTVTIPLGATIEGYLTQTDAAQAYQNKADMSAYLTTVDAATTYQDKAGMTSYLQSSAIGTTVQGYDANTAKLNVVQSFSKAQRGAPVVLTDGATVTPDFSLSNNFTLTLGGNRTLANPTNLVAGQSGCIVITNGGSNTLVYGNAWKFPGGTAPAVTANGVDVLAYYVESATRITARMVGDVK